MALAEWFPLDRVQAVFSPTAAVRRAASLIAAGKPGPAFRLYVRASRSGLADAEYRVGRCYLEGAGVPLSHAEGVRWLEQAGLHGHVEAQLLLAVLYLHGVANPLLEGERQPGPRAPRFRASSAGFPMHHRPRRHRAAGNGPRTLRHGADRGRDRALPHRASTLNSARRIPYR